MKQNNRQLAIAGLTKRYQLTPHLNQSNITLDLYLRRNVKHVLANMATGRELGTDGRYLPCEWCELVGKYVTV